MIDPQWAKSATAIAWWVLSIGIGGAAVVLNFAYLPCALVGFVVVGVILGACGLIEQKRPSWRATHEPLKRLSTILALSLVLHAARPVHMGVMVGCLLVLQSVPKTWLRVVAQVIMVVFVALAATLPFALYEWSGESSELAILYRLGCAVAAAPFLAFALSDRERS